MNLHSLSPSHRLCPAQLPAPNSVAVDMSMQSQSDVKVKEEAPVDGDSLPPSSPESISEESDIEPLVKAKVGQNGTVRMYREEGGSLSDVLTSLLFSQDTPPRSSAPTPTIVRPGSLPLHLGFDSLQPTMPSPTSVITQAPPSNRTLG